MSGTKYHFRSPVAESQSSSQQWFLDRWNGKCAQRHNRSELQQFTTIHALKLAVVYTGRHRALRKNKIRNRIRLECDSEVGERLHATRWLLASWFGLVWARAKFGGPEP